jgi:hypothetical protein
MRVGGYEPRFDFKVDLEYGHGAETNLIEFFNAVQNQQVEVKADRYRNGRMIVETQQRPNGGDWQHSGINVTTATWWAYQLAPSSFILVSVARLRRFLRMNDYLLEKRDFAVDGDNPARGFLLSASQVHELQTSKAYD